MVWLVSNMLKLPIKLRTGLITVLGLFIIIVLVFSGNYSLTIPVSLLTMFTIILDILLTQERLTHQGHIRAMRVLLEHNKATSQLVDYSKEAVIIVDRGAKILEASPKACEIFSISESCLIGFSIIDLGLPSKYFTLMEENKGEFLYKPPQSTEEQFIEFSVSPLLDKFSQSGFLVNLRDISQEKQKFEAYLQAAKFSVVGQVAAGLAHELRNPLTTIKGFMQLIGPEEWPQSFRPYRELILDEIKTTDELLRNFLLLTSPTAPQFQPISADYLISSAMKMLQPTCMMRDVSIIYQTAISNPKVLGDEEQILQALISILQNAIDASSLRGEIFVNLIEDPRWAKIIIQDQGQGISDEILDRVFDPFFTTRKEGTGLGLTIAQRIVLAHHGTLTINCADSGMGTKVTLSLPIFEKQLKPAS